ncbi:hypothetical protein ILYODFUR_023547 [Ilyodon furcidens]|uniref:Uncharacterized protein n=1 Tax=Ilyodon furcidens TaxID=33524 RepID=A0ABV0TBV2_9TELE
MFHNEEDVIKVCSRHLLPSICLVPYMTCAICKQDFLWLFFSNNLFFVFSLAQTLPLTVVNWFFLITSLELSQRKESISSGAGGRLFKIYNPYKCYKRQVRTLE